jgi:poly(3-hydroxybutyrate) depolymerase
MRHITYIRILFLLVFIFCSAYAQVWPQDYFEARLYSHDNYSHDLPYRLFIPDDYDAQKSYPLVTFLSGVGERGTDNLLQLTANEGATVWAKPENQVVNPSFVLAPQCPESDSWYDFASDQLSVSSQMTMDIIDSLIQEFSIDTSRLYLTGLSMGGYGTFDVITKNPHRFAAAVPICGGGDITQADKIAPMPIWIFHSDDDPTVPVENSRTMFQALLDAGSTSVLYTEYTGYGHFSWEPAYAESDLQKWVFAQKKYYAAAAPLAVAALSGESVDKWQINLSWQAPDTATYPETGAWYYAVYRDDQKIDTTRALFYQDRGLAESTTYRYEVRAVNYFLKESQDNTPVDITTLTDLEAPILISSQVVDQMHDSALVRIKFNEPMEENSAATLGNYQISPAADIYHARLSQDEKSVLLSIVPIEQDQDYTLTINNLKDRALAQNTLAANTATTCRRGEWLHSDIGPTEVTGSLNMVDNQFNISSNGYDIADTSDAFTFIHKNGEGNLSISARIAELSSAEPAAKAGVMIRETVEANSPQVSLVVLQSGEVQIVRRYRASSVATTTTLMESVDLPVYVKLERIDGKFYLYQSEDGLNWGEALRTTTIKMTDRAKIGLCLAAHSDSSISAVFEQINLSIEPLAIRDQTKPLVKETFQITRAYPNPFNPQIYIAYSLSPSILDTGSRIRMAIYNILGQRIYQEEKPAQKNGYFSWQGINQQGNRQASGMYLVELTYGKHTLSRKINLVK